MHRRIKTTTCTYTTAFHQVLVDRTCKRNATSQAVLLVNQASVELGLTLLPGFRSHQYAACQQHCMMGYHGD